MKNLKRIKQILAWVVIVVLAGLYLATLILSFMGSPAARSLFRGAFAATILLPVLLYAMLLLYRLLKGEDEPPARSEKKDGKH